MSAPAVPLSTVDEIARSVPDGAMVALPGDSTRSVAMAVTRALVQRAQVILADEPIASLDPESARRVMENLARINKEDAITVVVSLHQVQYARRYCPRTVALAAGRIVYDGPSEALTPDFLKELYGSDSEELVLLDAADPVAATAPAYWRVRPALAEA